MRPFYLALAFLAVSTAAMAQSTAPALVEQNSQIVARSPSATEAFKVQPDGKIRHLQSGGLCPAAFQNVAFVHALIFPAPNIGSDVGCDYGRATPQGQFEAKLTIFFVKAPENVTLDSIFAQYRQEIAMAYPHAKEAASGLKITDKSGQTMTNYRSASFTLPLGGEPHNSELIVGIFNGWIVKVRATSPPRVIREGITQDEIRNIALDAQNPYLAFMSARDSLTKR